MALSDIIDLKVEFGLGGEGMVNSLWDMSNWDEGLWSTDEETWTDMTSAVLSITDKTGKQAFLRRSRTGTATIVLDNTEGWFTPGAGQEPPGYLELHPGRPARILARPHGETAWEPIWYGRIDTLENQHHNGDLTAVVRCTDGFADLAVSNTVAVAPEGTGELTSERITRILDHHDWPADMRDIEPGVFTVQATTLADDALSECQLTTDAEGGDFWQKPDGRLAFRGRGWMPTTPTWILGLAGIGVESVQTEWTLQLVVNEAHYAKKGGTEQIVSDAASQALYGRRTYQRLDLINNNDAEVLILAQTTVAALKDSRLVVRTLDVAVSDYQSSVFVTDVSIGDMIELTVDTIHGWASTYRLNVISLADNIGPDGWVVTVGLTDVNVINENGPYSRDEFNNSYHLGGVADAESS